MNKVEVKKNVYKHLNRCDGNSVRRLDKKN